MKQKNSLPENLTSLLEDCIPPVSTAYGSAMIERPGPAVRDRLLKVALQLFAKKGYEATSVREIALASAVTKPTLYYYFKSKEGLYLESVEHLCRIIENAVTLSSVSDGTTREKIKSFVLNIWNLAISYKDSSTLLLGSNRDIQFIIHDRIVTSIKNTISNIVADGIKSNNLIRCRYDDFIRSLMSHLLFYCYEHLFLKRNIDDEEIEMMLDKLLDRMALEKTVGNNVK